MSVSTETIIRKIFRQNQKRHLNPTVPHSNQVHKWIPATLMLEVTLRRTSIPSRGWGEGDWRGGGVEILQVPACFESEDQRLYLLSFTLIAARKSSSNKLYQEPYTLLSANTSKEFQVRDI